MWCVQVIVIIGMKRPRGIGVPRPSSITSLAAGYQAQRQYMRGRPGMNEARSRSGGPSMNQKVMSNGGFYS